MWNLVQQQQRKLKDVLQRYEIILRQIENKQGLGTAYRSESDEGLD